MKIQLQTPELALNHFLELHSTQSFDEANEHLQDAVRVFAQDAKLRFMLGSVLASQGQYSQALSQFELAVQLDPMLQIARFQLGSLRFTSGDALGARRAWEPFADLPQTHCLKCFKNGCEALMEDRFADAISWLQQGIEANRDNAFLNHDMQLLLQRVLAQPNVGEAAIQVSRDTH